ncbi:MAG TPA: hypothetical protein PKA27_10305 [Fimbriimonadaceae bacterium]|nr:hypothetical protein [Fimbriimonadaceae bacterium]
MKSRLSMAFEVLSGADGNVVARNTRNGVVLTPRVTPKNPKTLAQRNVRGYLTKAAKTFEGLDSAQNAAWNLYADTLTYTDPVSGKSYHPHAINVFVQLATKFLQLNPTGTIPVTPPASDFAGDTIVLTADSESAGTITFTANAANAAGVTTELLVQPLANQNRTPNANGYKHAGWKTFTSGSLTATVNVPVGNYAVAYRFVKNSTGQATELNTIPVVQVGFSVVQGTSKTNKKAA